jgi:hypothetical protein
MLQVSEVDRIKSDLLRRPDFIISIILAVACVLLTIGLILDGIRTFQKPEDLPNWLPWAFHFCFTGGMLLLLAGLLMRLMQLWGKKK